MEKRLVALSVFCLAMASHVTAAGGPSAADPAKGVALVITGAAARIPQEAALLEALDERGLLKDLAFVSGDSSGAARMRSSWARIPCWRIGSYWRQRVNAAINRAAIWGLKAFRSRIRSARKV